ncbi:MAG: glycosyltransferase [Paramuribaculum sp.]|nr:glycosyltransferase [Paramuribaculum sp.]
MEHRPQIPKIAAVIVTFNRIDMLRDAISAVKAQILQAHIIVINNGSTDGTLQYLNSVENITVITQENLGGAGGFYTGMKYACENGFDFVWVMDDDVLPEPDCLEILYKDYQYLSAYENVGYICSRVFSTTGEVANVPIIDYKANSTGYADWAKYLDKGIIKVESSTFVSVFIPTQVIFTLGLPYLEFFIWGDDTEYTRRITNSNYSAYLSGKSNIIHRRIGGALDINQFKDKSRIKMYSFSMRNSIFISRKFDSKRILFYQLYLFFKLAAKQLLKGQFLKSKVILTGIIKGLFFNPNIRYPEAK